MDYKIENDDDDLEIDVDDQLSQVAQREKFSFG